MARYPHVPRKWHTQTFGFIVVCLVLATGNGCRGKLKSNGSVNTTSGAEAGLSLKIHAPAESIEAGTTLNLTASSTSPAGEASDITTQTTWSVDSGAEVAEVGDIGSTKGQVKGIRSGTIVIRATYLDLSATATIVVTEPRLTALSLAAEIPKLPVGATFDLAVSGLYSNGTSGIPGTPVQWSVTGGSSVAFDSEVTNRLIGVAIGEGTIQGKVAGSVAADGSSADIVISATVLVTPAELTKIVVITTSTVNVPGLTRGFKATGIYSDKSTSDLTDAVTWSTENAGVATVSNSGLVTFAGAGQTNIVAALGGVEASAPVVVLGTSLDTITISTLRTTIPAGYKSQITAIGTYLDGQSMDLTSAVAWSSSNDAVAVTGQTAATRGVLSCLSAGSATISASLGTVSGNLGITVNNAGLSAIDLRPGSATVLRNSSKAVSALGIFSDTSTFDLTAISNWISNSPAVATVSMQDGSRGLVNAVGVGVAEVSAAYDSVVGRTQITVPTSDVMDVTLIAAETTIPLGFPIKIKLSANWANGAASVQSDVTDLAQWASNSGDVAFIDRSNGDVRIVPVKTGEASITGTFGGKSASVKFTVTAIKLESLSIAPGTASLGIGAKTKLVGTGVFQGGLSLDISHLVEWSSGSPLIAVALNDQPGKGWALGLTSGSALISARYVDGDSSTSDPTGSATITVGGVEIVDLTVTPATALIAASGTQQMTAMAYYSNGSSVARTAEASWSSSDTGVATVNSSGLVSPLANGVTNISAQYSGKTSNQVPVTVIGANPPANPTGITATPDSQSAITLNWTSAGGTTTGHRIGWQAGTVFPSTCNSGTVVAQADIGAASSWQITGLTAGTQYRFRICGVDAANNHSSGSTTSATTLVAPPNNPSGLVATAASGTQITLSWVNGGGTTAAYQIAWKSGGTAPANCTTDTVISSATQGSAVTKTITGLTASTQYSFRVCGANSNPTPDLSSGVTASATTDSSAPTAPGSFVATAGSPTQIGLTWTDSTNETSYELDWSANGSSGWASVSTPAANATSASHTSLSAATRYFYRLRAVNGSGQSSYATSDTYTKPVVPTNLAGTAASTTQINLTWDDMAGDSNGYKIAYKSGSVSPVSCTSDSTTTAIANASSKSITGLIAGTQYTFTICTSDTAAGDSVASTGVSMYTKAAAPSISATMDSSTQITISWGLVTGDTGGYKIAYKTGAVAPANCDADTTTTASSGATSKAITGLTASTQYTFIACTVNSTSGQSAASSSASGTTSGSGGSTTYNSGSGNFTVPAGVTSIDIELWGGGGGGGAGGGGSGDNGASGGGGGAYCKKTLTVTPGQVISYVVGSGGGGGTTSGTLNGGTGGASTAAGGTYAAGGGIGGLEGELDNAVATLGGSASGGDINTTGGSSTAVPSGNNGGAGGTAAGSGGTGGAGGLTGVPPYAGTTGSAPGGGGGGGAKTDGDGGAGEAGRVKFTW